MTLTQGIHYTPTEQRLMAKLETGKICSRIELQSCLMDELACRTSLCVHLTHIRQKLPPGYLLLYLMNGNQHLGWQLRRNIGDGE